MQKITILFIFFLNAYYYGQTSNINDTENFKDTLKTSPVNLFVKDSVLQNVFKTTVFKKNVIASYYANKFNGRKTASGTRFSNSEYTAAHKKLPFGTKVKVTNPENGKFVILKITDRGPFVRSREIDLSRRAFMDIATNKSSGILRVDIEIINK